MTSATLEPTNGLSVAREKLHSVWGYDEFRPLQDDAIRDVLAGRDSVVILPTGGGKSLCYQVPALVRDGMAVVVSPLISLMKDQVDALRTAGVDAAMINSTISSSEKADVADRIRRSEIRLLYVSPERLMVDKTMHFLTQQNISFFAIDEAHCVSQWGHDFRPEYRQLRIIKERFPKASVHAFTATASSKVRNDIADQLGLSNPNVLVGNFDRPNLIYRMKRSQNRLGQIREIIDEHPGESGIVYAITRREVDEISMALNNVGVKALPYHAGLDDIQRQKNQEAFIQETTDVVVATVAFGMGIDKANVRYVIHAGMPKSIEHYQQESGRAGRDGLPSQCVMMYSGRDAMTWKRILENGDRSNFDAAVQSVHAMESLCTSIRCRHASLVEYFGQKYEADNCGACDVCLGELDLLDEPLVLAQKILSCVYRLNERYGAGYTVEVLVGSKKKRIMELGHDKLSTYGLLADQPAGAIRTWIDQLISQGFLKRVGEYQTLSLTDQGRELLKGRGSVQLTKVAEATSNDRSRPSAAASWEGVDRGLFDDLRALRSQLATQRSVPAYVIFGDNTLREIARVRPCGPELMSKISGIGQKKWQDFGMSFFERMDAYCQQQNLNRDQAAGLGIASSSSSQPVSKSVAAELADQLFATEMSVSDVAKKIDRAESTTYGYLQNYITTNGLTDPSPWVQTDEIGRVEEVLRLDPENMTLKPVFESLDETVSYNDIRIIAACVRNRNNETL